MNSLYVIKVYFLFMNFIMVIYIEYIGELLIFFGVFLSIIYISYEYFLYLYRRYIVNFFF